MRRLQIGDTIGLVSPSSSGDKEKLEQGIKRLKELGYKVKIGKNAKNTWFSFAGSDKERAEDINEFFSDTEVKGILCTKGGYGGIRILNLLDYDLIKKNPKPLIGYSDITSLHMAIYRKTGLSTFHGPMVIGGFSSDDSLTRNNFLEVTAKEEGYIIENFKEPIYFYNELKSSGILVGGNLTVLVSNLGTEYDIDYTDKILFLEDIDEATYRIDRMLWHLKNLGVFEKIKGIILGDFAGANLNREDDMNLQEVFDNHFKDFGKPICYNVKAGHCKPMLTLEFGREIEIDGKNKILKVN